MASAIAPIALSCLEITITTRSMYLLYVDREALVLTIQVIVKLESLIQDEKCMYLLLYTRTNIMFYSSQSSYTRIFCMHGFTICEIKVNSWRFW